VGHRLNFDNFGDQKMSTPQRTADIAAGASVAAAGTSWIASANEVIAFVAGLIAIVAGVFAIISHSVNIREKLK
jgi:hypothetical protein